MRVNTGVKVIILGIFIFFSIFSLPNNFFQNVFQQQNTNYNLTTIAGRELASIEKSVSPYSVKKCGEVKHTDGSILTICLATFSGTTGGFYDPEKDLMVLGSFSQCTLVHEITHATTLHFYRKGFTDINSPTVQEKMAYNAESLLMQINAFKEDMNITSDISDAKKITLGILVTGKLGKDLAKK